MTPVAYARELFRDLGLPVAWLRKGRARADEDRETAALAWARSGALALTGLPTAPPVLPSVPLPSVAEGVRLALAALAPESRELRQLDGAALLGERAALAGLTRKGRTAPSGACRLIPARDAWLAVNLPRGATDRRLLPAWLERGEAPDPVWPWLASRLRGQESAPLVERARSLGLAVALATVPSTRPPRPWLKVWNESGEPDGLRRPASGPRVPPLIADLSALWAGPLCTHLLQMAGARVVKVESTRRPDGARNGPAAFFDLLNGGKQSVALDFRTASERAALSRLLDQVDVVVEASRPRALRQLGIDASAWVRGKSGRIWLSITGYGRAAPQSGWVAFGDDAAAAAGLSYCVPSALAPLCVADAVADPLAGLHAALAVMAYWQRGIGGILDVSLQAVVAHAIACRVTRAHAQPEVRVFPGASSPSADVYQSGWLLQDGDYEVPVAVPRARTAKARAPRSGADNAAWLACACMEENRPAIWG